jgi:multisubunit Na+/H+ antiporter MnhC subunit
MNNWKDYLTAVVIGLSLAVLALHYFDVLFY